MRYLTLVTLRQSSTDPRSLTKLELEAAANGRCMRLALELDEERRFPLTCLLLMVSAPPLRFHHTSDGLAKSCSLFAGVRSFVVATSEIGFVESDVRVCTRKKHWVARIVDVPKTSFSFGDLMCLRVSSRGVQGSQTRSRCCQLEIGPRLRITKCESLLCGGKENLRKSRRQVPLLRACGLR